MDRDLLNQLAQAIAALRDEPLAPLPAGALEALGKIAKPGTRLSIDLRASQAIGAPLVTVTPGLDDGPFLAGLTRRQREVAGLVLEGLTNQQIAARLHISLATVKDHVHAVLSQLGLPSRAALIAASRAVSQS